MSTSPIASQLPIATCMVHPCQLHRHLLVAVQDGLRQFLGNLVPPALWLLALMHQLAFFIRRVMPFITRIYARIHGSVTKAVTSWRLERMLVAAATDFTHGVNNNSLLIVVLLLQQLHSCMSWHLLQHQLHSCMSWHPRLL